MSFNVMLIFMKEWLQKNSTIILAFLLPLLLIGGIAVSTYFPSSFLATNYNFIYAICIDNSAPRYIEVSPQYLQKHFKVVSGMLTTNSVVIDEKTQAVKLTTHLFLHDTQKNESVEITLKEAQTYTLSNFITSPDGVTVVKGHRNRNNIFVIFGVVPSRSYYLKQGKGGRKLNLIYPHSHDSRLSNIEFIAWILPKQN